MLAVKLKGNQLKRDSIALKTCCDEKKIVFPIPVTQGGYQLSPGGLQGQQEQGQAASVHKNLNKVRQFQFYSKYVSLIPFLSDFCITFLS